MKIIAEIPARFGSKRVKQKNLRELDGKPLILHAIEAAKGSKKISEIYVNTESDLLGNLAKENGVRYYKRDPQLAEDEITSDEFNYDFMKHVDADMVVMVNPVAPLMTGDDIDKMIAYYIEKGLDTLIPVKEERLHAFVGERPANFEGGRPVQSFCPGRPVNFDVEGRLPMTQNIEPIKICVWTVCIWNPKIFLKSFEEKGHAVFSGKVGFYPQSPFQTVKISTEEDFKMAELLIENEHKWRIQRVVYDSESVDSNLPTMWLKEIRFIEKLLLEQAKKDKPLQILEWGSGRSTTYFSNFLRERGVPFQWHAIENFVPWYDVVQKMIQENDLLATTTCHLKSPTHAERKALQERMDMSDFIHFPETLNQKFDFILVDARKRRECMQLAAKLVSPQGVVVLHDAERLEGDSVFQLYKEGGRFVCETPSPVPGGLQKLWVGQL